MQIHKAKAMTTLQNSYCVPKTEDEWRKVMPAAIGKVSFGAVWFAHGSLHNINPAQLEYGGRTEIPVQHFLDLLHDRIAPWRLKEVGFVPFPDEHNTAMMRWENDAQYTVEVIGGGVYVNNASYNITTFTDLLTLIKFLTPPVK